jgi:L-aspartate oxidase
MRTSSDFLVIGSGIAGLTFALRAQERGSVHIITKKEDTESNTNYAQGGIASVCGAEDSFRLHVEDTLKAGAGIAREDVAEMVVREGPALVEELCQLGVAFTRAHDGGFDLGREGGHSRRRIVHAMDRTGGEVEKTLVARCKDSQNIRFFEDHVAINLVLSKDGRRCCGAYVLDTSTGRVDTFLAKVILLATGGAGQVYRHTTNPSIATGDGVAMAYRAGVPVCNVEFVQFHPTMLYHPRGGSFLISEAVRGEGARLVLADGGPFVNRYDERGELAPRDVVARAIDNELKKTGGECAYLDLTHLDASRMRTRFPNIYETCLSLGIDFTTDPIPVVPAAHYMCGGVSTDEWGATELPGLYAAGEVACTGLHGANRLASNSLLEALVFAHRAAMRTGRDLPEAPLVTDVPDWSAEGVADADESVLISHNREEIRAFMWDYVGIVRSVKRLSRAQRRMNILRQEIEEYYWAFTVTGPLIELRNIALVAELIIKAATVRKESRGLHYNLDYPRRDDEHWSHDTILRR